MSKVSFHTFELIKEAAGRGVRVRVLVRDSWSNIKEWNHVAELSRMTGLEIRYSSEIPVGGLAVFDDERIFLRIGDTLGNALWTNNSNIVKLGSVYFEKMWGDVQTFFPR